MPYGKYVFLSHKIDKKSEYVKNIELFISLSGQLYILKISVVREILKTPRLHRHIRYHFYIRMPLLSILDVQFKF